MLVIKLVKNNLKHYLIFIFFILDQAHMNFQNFILLLHRAKKKDTKMITYLILGFMLILILIFLKKAIRIFKELKSDN